MRRLDQIHRIVGSCLSHSPSPPSPFPFPFIDLQFVTRFLGNRLWENFTDFIWFLSIEGLNASRRSRNRGKSIFAQCTVLREKPESLLCRFRSRSRRTEPHWKLRGVITISNLHKMRTFKVLIDRGAIKLLLLPLITKKICIDMFYSFIKISIRIKYGSYDTEFCETHE